MKRGWLFWRRWFQIKKIRSRFLIALIGLSVPPLFILGYISFNISENTLLDSNMHTNEDHLRTSSDVADLVFRNAINLNRSIVWNELISEKLGVVLQLTLFVNICLNSLILNKTGMSKRHACFCLNLLYTETNKHDNIIYIIKQRKSKINKNKGGNDFGTKSME